MDKILKEKVKNIILTKDNFTPEETKLIVEYLRDERGSILDQVLSGIQKIVRFINSNTKEGDNK